ncbi:hypothetical protein M3Y95_00734400 [Aphelenchoides besseyi]|nr:hypothetical protein M3Y95_00734400 [Aphelenchoides besseyi]
MLPSRFANQFRASVQTETKTKIRANAALGRLYSAYLYTTETLKALRSQEAIIGFNELQFMMKHPHLNILNYTYSNISCKPESLQIQAKACIVSAPNDDFYLPYFRQDEKGNLTLGTSWWQDGRKHKTTYHHKTLFENAIDKQPTFMIRTNDTLTFFSNENCFIPHAEDGHLLDRRSGFWLSAGFRIISCSRKNIVATHNYDLEKDCNLFEYDSSSDSRHPSYYFATYVNNSPTVLLNCTLDDRNITVEEIVTWQPYAIQHRLHSQSASGELAQKKMNEISVWNHNQLFEIDHTNTSLDVEFDREKQTELQSTKACSGTETSFYRYKHCVHLCVQQKQIR